MFLASNKQDKEDFSLEKTFQIHKNFFNRTDGELKMRLTMEKNSAITSIKPRALITGSTTKTNKEKIMNSEQDSLPSSSEESFKSGKSNSSKQIIQKHCFVLVDLIFKPTNNSGKTDLPSSVVISPSLETIRMQSLSPIPVVFDEEFFLDEQLIQKTIPKIKRKYESYLRQLKDMVVDKKYLVPRSLFDRVNAMNKISVWKNSIEKLFISDTIDLQNKWEFDRSFPITVRHLESILRIAESFAKMRLSEFVSSSDLDKAIKVVVDSFIGAQKISIRKQLQRSFMKYTLPQRKSRVEVH